jgi:hypothetical protein
MTAEETPQPSIIKRTSGGERWTVESLAARFDWECQHWGLETPRSVLLEAIGYRTPIGPIETGEMSGVEFMSEDLPPAEWLIDELVEANTVGGLLGQYKAGKSLSGLQMCFAVSTGGMFLGRKVNKPGATVFVEYEGTRKRLQERYNGMAAKHGALVGGGPSIVHRPPFKIDTDEGVEFLRAICAGKVLCVIGPVSKAATILRENEPTEWQALSERIQRVVDETGCTIILVHHTRKPNAQYGPPKKVDDYFNTARGSNSYMGAVDFALGVQREQEDDWGHLFYLERDGSSGRLRYDFDRASLCIWPSEKSDEPETVVDRQEKVLAFIGEHPDCTKDEIVGGTGFSLSSVEDYIRALKNAGRVTQTAPPGATGRYRVTGLEVVKWGGC